MLKDKMMKSIQKNIADYERLLKVLMNSEIIDKNERILQCSNAIEKQKLMLKNMEKWGDDDE